MGEGLYRPSEISLPEKVREALTGVVKIKPKIRFRVTLFASTEEAAAARAHPLEKEFLPEGGTIWPVIIDLGTLHQLCQHPSASLQPGFYELCAALEGLEAKSFPCTLLTKPLAGSATGFAAGHRDGELLITTCYHVARDVIERFKRTDGVYAPTPVRALDLIVEVSGDGSHHPDSYREVQPVFLVMNASQADWQQGQDWAVFSVPGDAPIRVLKRAPRVPEVGETLWAAGFPCRTRRPPERLKALNYHDANDELRISFGEVVEVKGAPPAAILVDLDGVSGNSGSPVFNAQGEVVGILHDTTYREGEIDLRVGQYGGLAQVVPMGLLPKL